MKRKLLYLIPLSAMIIGCGTTETTSTPNGEGSIDLRSYLEKEDISKNYQLINKEVGQNATPQFYTESTTVSADKVERKIDGISTTIINIGEKKITYTDVSDEGNIETSFYRHVDINDILFSVDINKTQKLMLETVELGTRVELGSNSCKLEEQLKEFTHGSNSWTGDILKIKCTKTTTITTKIKDEFVGTVNYINGTEDSLDISYKYQKKDTGVIASIDDNCIPANMHYPDDSTECSDENKSYSYIYYLGN